MTLHWFVHPRWFDLLGGFTKAGNISIYVEWAETAFKLFGALPAVSDLLQPVAAIVGSSLARAVSSVGYDCDFRSFTSCQSPAKGVGKPALTILPLASALRL